MMIVCLFPLTANALNVSLKQKYSHTVLTDDYGILNEIDLDSYLDGIKHPPVFSKKSSAYIYWQCFSRGSVTVSLEDLGYSLEDDDESDIKYNGENKAKLTITVHIKGHIFHKYTVWGRLPITLTEDRFNQYLKIMQGERYVCLAGSYMENETRIIQGKNQQVHYWAFVKIKTKKGCEAYHENGCHSDYRTLSL
jgi:hypothetical protein